MGWLFNHQLVLNMAQNFVGYPIVVRENYHDIFVVVRDMCFFPLKEPDPLLKVAESRSSIAGHRQKSASFTGHQFDGFKLLVLNDMAIFNISFMT